MAESGNDLIRKLDAAVAETKKMPVWRDAYMMLQLKMQEVEIRGEARGRAEGQAEGRAEGKTEGRIEVAKNMLREAEPIEKIARLSGLSITKINELKAQLSLGL